MSWSLSFADTTGLTGFYPGGLKKFRLSDSLAEECSGLFEWRLSTINGYIDSAFVLLDCSLPFTVPDDWTVDTDLIARVIHPDNPNKILAKRRTWTFSNSSIKRCKIWSFKAVSIDFWKDGNLTVEVEIGIKSISENILKAFEDKDDFVVFVMDDNKFYSKRSIIADKSKILNDIAEERKQYSIYELCVPFYIESNVYQAFFDIINGESPNLQIKLIKDLMRLADQFKVAEVTKECEKYLIEEEEDLVDKIKVAERFETSTSLDHFIDNITDLTVLSELLKGSRDLHKSTVEKLINKFQEIE